MPFQIYGLVVCVCGRDRWILLEKVADSARKAVKLAEPYKPYGGQFLEFCSISLSTYQTCMKLTRKSTEFCQFSAGRIRRTLVWGGGGVVCLCVRVCVWVCESVALTISRLLLMKLHVHVCVICRRLQCRGDCLLCVPLCLVCIINLSVLVFALHTYTYPPPPPAHKQTHTHTHTRTHAYGIRFQFEKCKVSCTCVRLMHSHELQRSMMHASLLL